MKNITHFINGKTTTGEAHRSRPIFNSATGVSDKVVILATAGDVDQVVVTAKTA